MDQKRQEEKNGYVLSGARAAECDLVEMKWQSHIKIIKIHFCVLAF